MVNQSIMDVHWSLLTMVTQAMVITDHGHHDHGHHDHGHYDRDQL